MGMNVLPMTILRQLFTGFVQDQRSLLETDPLTRAYLPTLQDSQDQLTAYFSENGKAKAARVLREASTAADATHDGLLTLLWQLLQTELASLRLEGSTSEVALTRLEAVISVLFPDGMGQINKSYLQEASEAPLFFSALSDSQRALLSEISYRGRTALDLTHKWVVTAERLGDLVRQRAVIEGGDTIDEGQIDGPTARALAIRRMRYLMETLKQCGLSPQVQAIIRNPVLSAIAEHERRLGRQADGAMAGDEAPTSATDLSAPVIADEVDFDTVSEEPSMPSAEAETEACAA